jgi:precorrin-6A/cobalt-precorrin-6A reductase
MAPVASKLVRAGGTRVLVLGGSTEASQLARRLADRPFDVVTSFAGRTRERVQPPGAVRVGGFGGIDGLARYLRGERIDVLVDATHPFAAQMPHHAAAACAGTGVPRLRLCRPPWAAGPGDRWHLVPDLAAAAAEVRRLGARRVFLTTGRQELAPFVPLADTWFLVRAIEEPSVALPPQSQVVLARGPFDEADEYALLVEHRIDAVVAKNSGGTATAAKLAATRRLEVPVVMVERPPAPPGPQAATVDDAIVWLDAQAPAG